MITDTGLCHVYNGNTISQTFADAGRNQDLKDSFEYNTKTFKPDKINGTGFQKQKTFWFDVGIRYCNNLQELMSRKDARII